MRSWNTIAIFLAVLFVFTSGQRAFAQVSSARDTVDGIMHQFEMEDRLDTLWVNMGKIRSHEAMAEVAEEYNLLARKFEGVSEVGEFKRKYADFGLQSKIEKWLRLYRQDLEKAGRDIDSLKKHVNQTIPIDLDQTSYVNLRWHMGRAVQKNPQQEQKAFDKMAELEAQVLEITEGKRAEFLKTKDTIGFTEEEVEIFDRYLKAVEKWKKTRSKVILAYGRGLEVPCEIDFRKRSIENKEGKRIKYWSIEGLGLGTEKEVRNSRFVVGKKFRIERNLPQETIIITFEITRLAFEHEGEKFPEEKMTIEWAVQIATRDGKTYTRFDLSPESVNHYPLGKFQVGKEVIYHYHDMFDVRAFYPYKMNQSWIYE